MGEETTATQYCKFLDLQLDGHAVWPMLDSGNTWRSAISQGISATAWVSA